MGITNVPSTVSDPQLRLFLQQVRETLSGAPTKKQLAAAIASVNSLAGLADSGAVAVLDYAAPSALTGLATHGLFESILLDWTSVFFGSGYQPGVAVVEVWRNTVDDRDTAVLHLTVKTDIAADYVEQGTSFYYWIRAISTGGTPGPFNSFAGVLGQPVVRATAILADLVDKVTASQLHDDLRTRVDLIDAPGTGLMARTNANTAGVQLLTIELASLSAGTNTQFDAFKTWYFDTGVEGWAGNFGSGDPSIINPGWLRPANGGWPAVFANLSGPMPGSQYTQLRLRIRKVGSPPWDGSLSYITATDGTWDSGKTVYMPEPSYDAGIGFVTLTMDGDWLLGDITALTFYFTSFQSTSDYIEVDWISVGRPSPGASTAELYEERTTREAADYAAAAQLNTFVTSLRMNTLNFNYNFVDWHVATDPPDGWLVWDLTGMSRLTSIYEYRGGHAVQFAVGAGDNGGLRYSTYGGASAGGDQDHEFVDINLRFKITAGTSLSGAGVLLVWYDAAGTGYSSANTCLTLKDIYPDAAVSGIIDKWQTCKATVRRPVFSTAFGWYDVYLLANYDGLNFGARTAKTIVFDELILTGSEASAKAITVTNANVAIVDGKATAAATAVTTLETKVKGSAASVEARMASIDGVSAQWSVKTSVNAITGGIGLYNNAGTVSCAVVADLFSVSSTGSISIVPFVIDTVNNRVAMNGAYIKTATIDNAAIANLAVSKLTGMNSTFVLATIGTGNITDSYIGNIIQSSGYVAGVSGWRLTKSGGIECRNIIARGDIEASSLKANTAMVGTLHVGGEAIIAMRYAAGSNQTFTGTPTTLVTSAAIPVTVGDISGVSLSGVFSLMVTSRDGRFDSSPVFDHDDWVEVQVLRDGVVLATRFFYPRVKGYSPSGGGWIDTPGFLGCAFQVFDSAPGTNPVYSVRVSGKGPDIATLTVTAPSFTVMVAKR